MTKCGSGGWADVSTRRSPKAVKLRGSFKTFAMECLGVKGVFAEAAGQFCGISRSTIKRWAKEVQPRKRKRTVPSQEDMLRKLRQAHGHKLRAILGGLSLSSGGELAWQSSGQQDEKMALQILALRCLEMPDITVGAVATFIGVSDRALNRWKAAVPSVGGRQRKVSKGITQAALKTVIKAGQSGKQQVDPADLEKTVHLLTGAAEEELARTPPRRYWNLQKAENPDLGLKAMRCRQKSAAKMAATAPSRVKVHFEDLANFAKAHSWRNFEGCGKGIPAMPACAVIASDEMQMCVEDGGLLTVVCGGKSTATVQTTGLNRFKLSLVVSVSLDGSLLPCFGIFDGKEWQTSGGRLRHVSDDFGRFTCTAHGGMTGTSGDGATLRTGTMVQLANLWKDKGRMYCDGLIEEFEWILHLLDNHKSHLDDVAIEILDKAKHFVQTLPKNTTHFMQVSNRPHKHTHRARAFALTLSWYFAFLPPWHRWGTPGTSTASSAGCLGGWLCLWPQGRDV